jgi:hypothetical protein
MPANDAGRFTFNNKNNSQIIEEDGDDVILMNSNRESKNRP